MLEIKLMRKYKRVYIEITNVCNLKCDFCPQTKRKPEFMSTGAFSNILVQIKPHTQYIYLHVKGEPLLHPELDKLLDISHEKGFQVNITTNGTLINKVKDMLLTKPALRQINFSLHSLHGNKEFIGKEAYIDNILSFIKEAMIKTEIYLSLRLWNIKENNSIITEKRKNVHILEAIENAFSLSYKIEEVVGLDRGIKIDDRLYLNQAHQFSWPDLNENQENERGFCYGLRSHAAILVDGTVVPCCLDGEGVINLGNINKNNFSDIIDSQRAINIVDGFTKKEVVEELCRKCGYMKRF
jgi:radical SAM protein with 4Fe4S-binding SPASM domain